MEAALYHPAAETGKTKKKKRKKRKTRNIVSSSNFRIISSLSFDPVSCVLLSHSAFVIPFFSLSVFYWSGLVPSIQGAIVSGFYFFFSSTVCLELVQVTGFVLLRLNIRYVKFIHISCLAQSTYTLDFFYR
jgi:hypothetical protein